jgi:protein gp37
MAKSKIDYADWSWGIVDGCTHADRPGCDNCYARAMADRFWGERIRSTYEFIQSDLMKL